MGGANNDLEEAKAALRGRGMPAKRLSDLGRTLPNLSRALLSTSKEFFEPVCSKVFWEVDRKRLENETLVLVPSQPVNRAWEMVLHVALPECLLKHYGSRWDFPDLYRLFAADPRDLGPDGAASCRRAGSATRRRLSPGL